MSDFSPELSASTRSLEMDSWYLYNTSLDEHSLDKHPHVIALARSLHVVSLIDQHDCTGQGVGPISHERGAFDWFIARLDSVVHLTISPVALASLSSLAELRSLRDLKLVLGIAVPARRVEPSELIDLFAGSTSLLRVAIAQEITSTWSAWEMRRVEDAAKPNIQLTWI